MRILFALPYGPGPTRIRSRMILERLCTRHDVTLLGLAWDASDREAFAAWRTAAEAVNIISHERQRQIRGIIGNPIRPFQEMVSTSPAFATRIRELIQDGIDAGRPYDAVHIEHFRGASAANLVQGLQSRVVYDAVDCLALLAEQAHDLGASRSVRLVAGLERWRTRRAEDRLLGTADVVTVVADRDRAAMVRSREADNVIVVPNGVERSPLGLGCLPRTPRAIFTGKLSYHANQAAVKWLLEDIWPRVQQSISRAELVVAGADPPDWLKQASRQPGIHLVANPPDMDAVIRTARVAVAPNVYSVGIQNKVLEAMAAGRPVIATTSATVGLGRRNVPGVVCADSAGEFASEIVRLFQDHECAERLREGGYRYVIRNHDWDVVVGMFEELYGVVTVPAKVA